MDILIVLSSFLFLGLHGSADENKRTRVIKVINGTSLEIDVTIIYLGEKKAEQLLGINYAKTVTTFGKSEFFNSKESLVRHQINPLACIEKSFETQCLYLNIWSPIIENDKKKLFPVLVWLVGGLFKSERIQREIYMNPSFVADFDTVLVTVQYRIGHNGFLYLDNDEVPGNAGLQDQILALKWVRKYIRHFNGDVDNIVLAGDDVGAASVGFHLLSPETSQLFKSAFMLNGVPLAEWTFKSKEESFHYSKYILDRSGCAERVECLRNPPKDFKDWGSSKDSSIIETPFVPTIGINILPKHPLAMLMEARHLKGKKIMIGNSKQAGLIIASGKLKERGCEEDNCYSDHYRGALLPMIKNNLSTYQNILNYYKNSSKKSYKEFLASFITDRYFRCPVDLFAHEARRLGATVYQFEFDYIGNEFGFERRYFLDKSNNYKPAEYRILNKAMHQLAGFLKDGNPSSFVDQKWRSNQVFYIGLRDGSASDRNVACQFLKDTIEDYLPLSANSNGSNQKSLGLTSIFIASVFLFRVIIG